LNSGPVLLPTSPPAEVQAYLQAALRTTYADYPRRHLLDFAPRTPFDQGLEATVAYLESFMEKDDDH
jgi:nucleoside-diphosphate-sugar epimerase